MLTNTKVSEPNKEFRVENPIVSIVVPALNEEITISEFIDWCHIGIANAGIPGEIIIIDSSSDSTGSIALSKGARVVHAPKGGLGRAYKDALQFVRGDFLILGDCDLTYDFREIKAFVTEYKKGSEFVMGSRFRGNIEDGAMPRLHRYFGTPLTNWILNRIYKTKFTDIHCGMRGITIGAFSKLELTSNNWEYASEMVLKAARLGLRISEVPVNFYRDRAGRLSHHKRAGFFSPWFAGWINLKVMLVFSAETFTLGTSIFLLALGSVLSIISGLDSILGGMLGFGSLSMLAGLSAVGVALGLFQVSVFAQAMHGLTQKVSKNVLKNWTYDRGMLAAGLVFVASFVSVIFFVANSPGLGSFQNHPKIGVLGLGLFVIGTGIFSGTLLFELIRRIVRPKP